MTLPAVNFSGRDYTAEFQRLLELLKAELPEWTDWNHSDFGVVMLRLLGRETDQLNSFIDRVAAEGFLRTAQFKQSLIELGSLVGYLPTLASPAATTLRITRAEGIAGPIFIPKWSDFQRPDGIGYLNTNDYVILDDAEFIEIPVIQGERLTVNPSASDLRITDLTKRKRINLGKSVAAASVEATHGSDPIFVWAEVDSFWRSREADLHFILELNGDTDDVWMVFGDGKQGAAPPDDGLTISFTRTAEAAGNCGHSLVTSLPDELEGTVTCSNTIPATGGAPAETTESLRRMIPRVVRTQRRGVILEDYEALIEHIPGVLHCKAMDRNGSPEWPHSYVALFVVPEGGGQMSPYLRGLILLECSQWGHLGPWSKRYILRDAVAKPLNIIARIGVIDGYAPELVVTAARSAFSQILAVQNRTIGETLRFSDLHNCVSGIPGLSWIEFDAPTMDEAVSKIEIITEGVLGVTAQ